VIIAFLLVGDELRPLAEKMVASCKRHMPTVPIMHMRDEKTQEIDRCMSQVLPWDGKRLMLYRGQHLAALPRGDVLSLDVDVIVQRDLRPVFHKPFDVALTKRKGPILDGDGVDIAKLMPYNAGVMFSTRNAFWTRVLEIIKDLPEEAQNWWGDQLAVKAAAPEFNTLDLPCSIYNYTPATEDEDVSDKAVVHYKGNRKDWMLRRQP
jgi:hypothetical protein